MSSPITSSRKEAPVGYSTPPHASFHKTTTRLHGLGIRNSEAFASPWIRTQRAKATSGIDSITRRKITKGKGDGFSVLSNIKTLLGAGKGGWRAAGAQETMGTKASSRRAPAVTWTKTGGSEGARYGVLTSPKTLLGAGGGRWKDKNARERKRKPIYSREPATRRWMSVRKEAGQDGLRVDSRTLRETDWGRWMHNNWLPPRVNKERGSNVWQSWGKVGIPRTPALRQGQGWLKKLEWKPSLSPSSVLKPWTRPGGSLVRHDPLGTPAEYAYYGPGKQHGAYLMQQSGGKILRVTYTADDKGFSPKFRSFNSNAELKTFLKQQHRHPTAGVLVGGGGGGSSFHSHNFPSIPTLDGNFLDDNDGVANMGGCVNDPAPSIATPTATNQTPLMTSMTTPAIDGNFTSTSALSTNTTVNASTSPSNITIFTTTLLNTPTTITTTELTNTPPVLAMGEDVGGTVITITTTAQDVTSPVNGEAIGDVLTTPQDVTTNTTENFDGGEFESTTTTDIEIPSTTTTTASSDSTTASLAPSAPSEISTTITSTTITTTAGGSDDTSIPPTTPTTTTIATTTTIEGFTTTEPNETTTTVTTTDIPPP